MTEVTTEMISITDRAAAELNRLLATEQAESNRMLRVGVKGGGCSGLTYILDFDTKGEFDEVHHVNGVDILLDPRHGLYLMGMEVDYQKGLNDRGFIFNNPNAKESCGCGTSFST